MLRGRCQRIPEHEGEIKRRKSCGSSWQSSTSASQLCKTTQNLIKRVHFLYKAFYGRCPLLRHIYFSITHIRTSRLLPGDPLEAFSFINFSHQFCYLEWTFTPRGCSLIPPDLSQPSLHLPQWRIIVQADHSSSFFHHSAALQHIRESFRMN